MTEQKLDLMKFNSPATGYDVLLAELNKKEDSKHEKMIKVFEIFEKMIPLLGYYAEIMKTIRRELLDAVFSDFEFTGKDSKVERVSYYQLYKKLVESKDERAEDLKQQLEQKNAELKAKENEIKRKNSEIKQINESIENEKQKMTQLENDLADKKLENTNLEKKLLKTEVSLKKSIDQLEKQVLELQTDLNEKNAKIKELTVYKNGYDELNNAFSPEIQPDPAKAQLNQLNMNRKNQIANDLINAKKLEEQLLVLINISTEEYDRFIEKQNESLVKRLMPPPRTDSTSNETTPELSRPSTKIISTLNLDKQEKEELAKQMEKERLNYTSSIMELKREYEMTVQHRMGLEEKMYQMEVDKETAEFVKQQKARVALQRSQGEIHNLLTGLEEHYDPIRKGADKDIFAFQDRIFSKWACRMQTSVDGEIWYDSKNVAFCENCGEKTLICPHKLAMNEDVLEVPVGTRYLKFTRPRLQFNQNLVRRGLEVYKKQVARISSVDLHMSAGNILTNYANEFPAEIESKLRDESIRGLNEGNPNIGMPHNYQRIWMDFSQRSGFKRQVPRHLTYDRTISIMQQFMAYLHNKEVYDEVEPVDVVESLYEFFEKRYEIEDIKFAAVYDFLASTSFYAGISRFIELFCHVLIGNFDRGILNYVLYMGELISRIEWTDSEDAKIFFAIIYPYCDDDELEELVLDFISFGENKINKKIVWDFIMMQILRKREFLINEVEARLSSKVSNDSYTMTEGEFYRAVEEFFMLNEETQVRIAYRTALAHSKWDSFQNSVPVTKLSHIAAYYCLLQIVSELQGNVQKIMTESRQKILENELKLGPVPKKISSYVEPQGEFLVMSDIDKMSIINRELE